MNKIQYYMDKIERGDTWVSDKVGVRRETVSRWKHGTMKPELDNLIKLAKLFDCTVEDLIA